MMCLLVRVYKVCIVYCIVCLLLVLLDCSMILFLLILIRLKLRDVSSL